jgi:type II secretory pathway predicted ATPase ExeA
MMYRKHFGLTRHPFDNEIDVDHLFGSAALRELEARLEYLFELRGIGLVTGEPGSGKTTGSPAASTRGSTGSSTCPCPPGT